MHSHKFIAMALVLAMVLTGMAVLMPNASAASQHNIITDAPETVEVGTEYRYAPDIPPSPGSLKPWSMLTTNITATKIVISGAPWLSYDLVTREFAGTPTVTGVYNIAVACNIAFQGEIVNSWTVNVVEANPLAFTSSLGEVDQYGNYNLMLLAGHYDPVEYTPTTNKEAVITALDENYEALPSWILWQDGKLTITSQEGLSNAWVVLSATAGSETVEQWIWVNFSPFEWVYETILAGPPDIYITDSNSNIDTPIMGDGTVTVVDGPDWLIGEVSSSSAGTFSFRPTEAGLFNITVRADSSVNPDVSIFGNFSIRVWNEMAFVSANPSMTIYVGQEWSYTPATNNDPTAVIGFHNKPDWVDYDSINKTFSGTPDTAGNYPVIIYARAVLSTGQTFREAVQEVYLTVLDEDTSTEAPTAGFTVSNGQNGMSIILTDQSVGATHYLWDFGDGRTSTVANPVHVYSSAGTYNVTLTVANAAGSDSMTLPVSVGTVAAPPTTATKGEAYTFTPSAAGPWMQTAFGANVVLSGAPWLSYDAATKTITGTPSVIGSYNVTATVVGSAAYGGNASVSWTVTVIDAMPIANFSMNAASGIAPFTVYFLDSSVNAQSYLWSFGDGETSTLRQSPHVYWMAGYYEVSLTVSNSAGSDTKTEIVHVAPAATTVYHDTAAPGTGTVGVPYQYAPVISQNSEWAMLSSSVTSTQITITGASWLSYDSINRTFSGTPENAGHYDVRVSIYLPFYGEKVNGWTVIVAPADEEPEPGNTTELQPLAAFVVSKISGPAPLNVSFIDYSARATTWLWDFGDGTGSTERNVAHVYTAAGTYNVTLIVGNDHGNDSYTRTITVSAAIEDEGGDDEPPVTTDEQVLLDKLLGNNIAMGMLALGVLCLAGAALIRRPLPAIVGILLLVAMYLLLEGWWAI
jgi:PKD repeat protein